MTEEHAAQIIEALTEEMTITEALEYIRQIADDYADDTEPTEEPTP